MLAGVGAGALGLLAGCAESSLLQGVTGGPDGDSGTDGRLSARPNPQTGNGEPTHGISPLRISEERDFQLFVPDSYRPDKPAPLTLSLHGAGGGAGKSISRLQKWATEGGIILVGAASRARTWDVIQGGFGEDVTTIDGALRKVFDNYSVNPQAVAVAGFSDGASYALSLGLTNGDLFRHVLAFSPGFSVPEERRGRPSVFITHGIEDPILPIDRTSRQIVPELRAEGYDVRYVEFDGGHRLYRPALEESLRWYLGDSP